MNNNYPKTIDNGASEKLTFLRRYEKDGIEYLDAENEVSPGGGPPMHVHHLQDEGFTVLEGKLACQSLGEEPKYYYPGESVLFRRGVPHKFWNAGDTTLKCIGTVTPVYNIEYFLSEIFSSVKRNGNGRPGAFDAAFLLNRYKSEFDMLEIPLFVRKIIFPVVLFFGKIMRRHKKFINAPKPVINTN